MSEKDNSSSSVHEEEGLEFTIRVNDILKGVMKFWWVCAFLAVFFGVGMFFHSYFQYVPEYKAEATFTVSVDQVDSIVGASTYTYLYSSSTASQLVDTFPTLLNTRLMTNAIVQRTGGVFGANLIMESLEGTNMFTITAKGNDPQNTYDTLVAAIDCYPEIAKYVLGNIFIDVITEPEVPSAPTNSGEYVMQAVKGALFGIALGFAWIFLYAINRKTIRNESDINTKLKTEMMGTLPVVTFKKYKEKIDQSVLITNPLVGGRFKEEVKVLRNTLLTKAGNRKVIMFTSTAPGEGKTTIAVNIALSVAQSDKKVLLIDGDLRNPSVCHHLGIEKPENANEKGYSIDRIETAGLDLLTFYADKKNILSTMKTEKLKLLVDSLRDKYDYIIVDTPPCGLISDSLAFAQVCDGAVFTVLHDTIRASRVRVAMDMLNSTDIDVIGCIINGISSGIRTGYGYNRYTYSKYGYSYSRGRYGYYGYYGKSDDYGYGYGYGHEKKSKKE